jgi:glycosyltransferase involved in cell wall biosynthesis
MIGSDPMRRNVACDRACASMISTPLVSVCIPTFNRAKKLARALDSLVECDYKNLEIIVSDNCSTDDTRSIVERFRSSDGRISYFRHPSNMGPSHNFAFARSLARGKYFMWLADDDYIDPSHVSRCVCRLEADPSIVMVSGLSVHHSERDGTERLEAPMHLDSEWRSVRIAKYLWSVRENGLFYGLFRASSVADCSVPNILAGDWAFLAEVLCCGRVLVMPDATLHRSGDGASASYRRIVSALGLPSWNSAFPWLAMSIGIGKHLLSDSRVFARIERKRRLALAGFVSGLVLARGATVNARNGVSRIPLARGVYAWLQTRPAGS